MWPVCGDRGPYTVYAVLLLTALHVCTSPSLWSYIITTVAAHAQRSSHTRERPHRSLSHTTSTRPTDSTQLFRLNGTAGRALRTDAACATGDPLSTRATTVFHSPCRVATARTWRTRARARGTGPRRRSQPGSGAWRSVRLGWARARRRSETSDESTLDGACTEESSDATRDTDRQTRRACVV